MAMTTLWLRMMKKVFVAMLLSCLLLYGCSYFGKNSSGRMVINKETTDFSEQAQKYLEYIGTNLTDRNCGISQHDDARDWIIAELLRAGYTKESIILQEVEGAEGQNIILKVSGAAPDDERFIVAGAHYDGDGVGDNGSGIALLLATAVGLRQYSLPMTTYYVFFDQEESDLYGSETFVNSLSKEQLHNLQYMINIDAIAFGDYCNIYGGAQNPETKEISQTQIYEYACHLAEDMGFHVYGTSDLDGYYAEHGKGPALDKNGIFTNPWTLENPAPEDSVEDEFRAFSPSTVPASDHLSFMMAGIPYVYFEATNWYVEDPDYPDQSYTGYSDVGDFNLGENGCIMNTEYDNLAYLNEHFPGRSMEHFRLYSPILSRLILEPYIESSN